MKLCKDCKKLIDGSICGDEKAFIDIDLVTGNRRYLWARSCRNHDDYCAIGAKWFEPTESSFINSEIKQEVAETKTFNFLRWWGERTKSRGPG